MLPEGPRVWRGNRKGCLVGLLHRYRVRIRSNTVVVVVGGLGGRNRATTRTTGYLELVVIVDLAGAAAGLEAERSCTTATRGVDCKVLTEGAFIRRGNRKRCLIGLLHRYRVRCRGDSSVVVVGGLGGRNRATTRTTGYLELVVIVDLAGAAAGLEAERSCTTATRGGDRQMLPEGPTVWRGNRKGCLVGLLHRYRVRCRGDVVVVSVAGHGGRYLAGASALRDLQLALIGAAGNDRAGIATA